jgi:hypothetical protein
MRKLLMITAFLAAFAARAEAAERTFSVHALPGDSAVWSEVSDTIRSIVAANSAERSNVGFAANLSLQRFREKRWNGMKHINR